MITSAQARWRAANSGHGLFGRVVLGSAAEALRLVPLGTLAQCLPRDVIGFCYHTVSEEPLPHVAHLYPIKTPAQFAADLDFLARHFDVVSYEELRNTPTPVSSSRPRAIITFDDGFAECYSVIRPLLLQHGMSATFFVTTNFLDNRLLFYRHKVSICIDTWDRLDAADRSTQGPALRAALHLDDDDRRSIPEALLDTTPDDGEAIDICCRVLGIDACEYLRTAKPYLTTEQVAGLDRDGFTIGAHSMSHAPLGLYDEETVTAEIVESCRYVSEMIGRPQVPFAFPFNSIGVHRNLLQRIAEQHTEVGPFFDTRMLARDCRLVINRIVVDNPAGATVNGSNLPVYLRRAYATAIAHAVAGVMGHRAVL